MGMPITISEYLLRNKKLLITEALLLFLIPLLWTFGGKIPDSQTTTEISKVLLGQIIATLSILCIAFVVACFRLAGIIKEQKSNTEPRRSLIARWRKMVHEVASHHNDTQQDISTYALLERHEDYYSLRPHLPHETIRQTARTTTFIAGSTISTPLKLILDDIDRLEKEWGLI
jgi:hypothetical protein